jgi:hypothetical protein
MMTDYYNTTGSAGALLVEREVNAKTQQELILEFFARVPGMQYSPSQVQQRLGLKCPLTSVRRAITNLTTDGKLRKTSKQIDGPYGHAEYTWTLARAWPEQQRSLFDD